MTKMLSVRRFFASIVMSVGLLLTGCDECNFEYVGEVSPPLWLKKVEPLYPPAARRAGADGTVVLIATVDVHGKARDIEIREDNVGFGCAQAAARALKDSRFIPAKSEGENVCIRISIPYKFVLVD